MSLFRAALILAAAVILLPADARKQAAFSISMTKAASETATFCERNVHTCGAGRELWSLLLSKAENGMELGTRLIREHRLHAGASDPSSMPATFGSLPRHPVQASPANLRSDPPRPQRSGDLADNPSSWR